MGIPRQLHFDQINDMDDGEGDYTTHPGLPGNEARHHNGEPEEETSSSQESTPRASQGLESTSYLLYPEDIDTEPRDWESDYWHLRCFDLLDETMQEHPELELAAEEFYTRISTGRFERHTFLSFRGFLLAKLRPNPQAQ